MMGISGLLKRGDDRETRFRRFHDRNANAGNPRAVDDEPRSGNQW
jgi:hypothetical protein